MYFAEKNNKTGEYRKRIFIRSLWCNPIYSKGGAIMAVSIEIKFNPRNDVGNLIELIDA